MIGTIFIRLGAHNHLMELSRQEVDIPARRGGQEPIDLAEHDVRRVSEDTDSMCGEDAGYVGERCGAGVVEGFEGLAKEEVDGTEVLVE